MGTSTRKTSRVNQGVLNEELLIAIYEEAHLDEPREFQKISKLYQDITNVPAESVLEGIFNGDYDFTGAVSANSLVVATTLSADSATFNSINLTGNITSGAGLFGNWSVDPTYAYFGHKDTNTLTAYGFLQDSNGASFLNAASGQAISVRIANSEVASFDATGLTVTGEVTTTSDALKVLSDQHAFLYLDRGTTSFFSVVRHFTAGVEKWRAGTINSGNEDYVIYDVVNTATRFQIDATSGAFNFNSNALSGITTLVASGAITSVGVSDTYGLGITSTGGTGQSYGLVVQAGTNASDYTFRLRDQAQLTDYFSIRGDGLLTHGTITATQAGAVSGITTLSSGSLYAGSATASAWGGEVNRIVGLDASGNGRLLWFHTTDSSGAKMWFTNATTGSTLGNGVEFGLDGAERFGFLNYSATDMYWGNNNTFQMTLTSAGNLEMTAGGSITTTGAINGASLVITSSGGTALTFDSAGHAIAVIDRGTTGNYARMDLATAGVTDWFFGMNLTEGNPTSNFSWFSYGGAGTALVIDYSTGALTTKSISATGTLNTTGVAGIGVASSSTRTLSLAYGSEAAIALWNSSANATVLINNTGATTVGALDIDPGGYGNGGFVFTRTGVSTGAFTTGSGIGIVSGGTTYSSGTIHTGHVSAGGTAQLYAYNASDVIFRLDASGFGYRIIVDQTGVQTQGTFTHTGNQSISGTLLVGASGTPAQAFEVVGSFAQITTTGGGLYVSSTTGNGYFAQSEGAGQLLTTSVAGDTIVRASQKLIWGIAGAWKASLDASLFSINVNTTITGTLTVTSTGLFTDSLGVKSSGTGSVRIYDTDGTTVRLNIYAPASGATTINDAKGSGLRLLSGATEFLSGVAGATTITGTATISSSLIIGGTTFGNGTNVAHLVNGTAPSAGVVDTIQLFSVDRSAGNTMLGIYSEGTLLITGTNAAANGSIPMSANGTTVYVPYSTTAPS